jgi:hypothetical protein
MKSDARRCVRQLPIGSIAVISKTAQRNFSASLRLLKQAEASSVALTPVAQLRTEEELARRARIVQSVLNARSLFANIHRRTHALNQALERFHARKRQIDADTPMAVESLSDWARPNVKSA